MDVIYKILREMDGLVQNEFEYWKFQNAQGINESIQEVSANLQIAQGLLNGPNGFHAYTYFMMQEKRLTCGVLMKCFRTSRDKVHNADAAKERAGILWKQLIDSIQEEAIQMDLPALEQA